MKTKIFTFLFVILTALLIDYSVTYSQWFQLTTGTTESLQDIYFSDVNTGVAVGTNGIIVRTTNGGANWSIISSSTANTLYSLDFPTLMTGFAGGLSGTVRRTMNCGMSWDIRSGCGINIRSIAFYNANTGITAGGGTLMCFTTDGGTSWNPRYLPQYAPTGITFLNSTTLLSSATDMPGACIYKSTNTGSNWSTVMLLSNSGLNIYYSLSNVYFKDQNTGFCTGSSTSYGNTSGSIYRTTNSGDNWTYVGGTVSAAGSGLNAIHFGRPDTGYAVGNNGAILRSINGGVNWQAQSSTVTTTLSGVYMLNALTGYVCGAGGVVLKTTNGGMVGFIRSGEMVPEKYNLYQNYPNPFNPVTKIKFDIPQEDRSKMPEVRLAIIDVLGKEIAVLVNEKLSPGTYEVDWDAGKYASGVYFYKLKAENFAKTMKLILVK